MTGFTAFVRKEFEEIRKTSRMWVLPGIMLFFGLTSPILAKLTPLLLKSTAGSQPGMTIQIPDPTYVDAYRGFAQNLTQIMIIAVIIATAGIISREVRSGAAALVLVKPVSRGGMVLAKALGQMVLLAAAGVLGGLVCWGATAATFGTAPLGPLAAALGLWAVLAIMFTAFMVLMSASDELPGGRIRDRARRVRRAGHTLRVGRHPRLHAGRPVRRHLTGGRRRAGRGVLAAGHRRHPHRGVLGPGGPRLPAARDLAARILRCRPPPQAGRRNMRVALAWSRGLTTIWSMFTCSGRVTAQAMQSAMSSATSGVMPS